NSKSDHSRQKRRWPHQTSVSNDTKDQARQNQFPVMHGVLISKSVEKNKGLETENRSAFQNAGQYSRACSLCDKNAKVNNTCHNKWKKMWTHIFHHIRNFHPHIIIRN